MAMVMVMVMADVRLADTVSARCWYQYKQYDNKRGVTGCYNRS